MPSLRATLVTSYSLESQITKGLPASEESCGLVGFFFFLAAQVSPRGRGHIDGGPQPADPSVPPLGWSVDRRGGRVSE